MYSKWKEIKKELNIEKKDILNITKTPTETVIFITDELDESLTITFYTKERWLDIFHRNSATFIISQEY